MIKEWTELNRIISRTSNYALAKEYGLLWVFFAMLIFYTVSSGIAIYLVYNSMFVVAVFVVGFTLCIMQLSLNNAFYKKYDETLKEIPHKKKLRYFKYLRFKDSFQSSAVLDISQIDRLLQWQEIECKKPDDSNFFATKIFTLPAAGLLAFVFGYFSKASVSFTDVTILVILVLGALTIASSLYEAFTTGIRRQMEITRSLKLDFPGFARHLIALKSNSIRGVYEVQTIYRRI